jgi:hypothetical protein
MQGITSMLCYYTAGQFLVAHNIYSIKPGEGEMAQVRTGRPLKNCGNSLGLLEFYDAKLRQEILLPNWPRKKPHSWEATT